MTDSPWLVASVVGVTASAWLVNRTQKRGRLPFKRKSGGTDMAVPRPVLHGIDTVIEVLAAFFLPLLVVAVAVSFVGRLFSVQSQSMVPTLRDADIVAAVRYELGWRVPILAWRLPALRDLRRGDVVVFRYPLHPSDVYIKRVLGVPGDTVAYDVAQGFTINGRPVPSKPVADYWFYETGIEYPRREEQLGNTRYEVITYTKDHRPSRLVPEPGRGDLEQCQMEAVRVTCTVPRDRVFVAGDNRDRSVDSRHWGLVPVDLVLGRVVAHLGNWKTIEGENVGAMRPHAAEPAAVSKEQYRKPAA
jgi:signal peptidase I